MSYLFEVNYSYNQIGHWNLK